MKKIFLLIAVLFVSSTAFSQKEKELKLNEETNLIEATYFHENGNISQKGTFNLEHKLHGEWVSYNAEGDKISVGSYTNGFKTGNWEFWSGEHKKEVVYKNNVIASVDGIKTTSGVAKVN